MSGPYAYCATLTRDQWTWEFLRPNHAYRADYQQFIAIWHALEADYGAPPNRDPTLEARPALHLIYQLPLTPQLDAARFRLLSRITELRRSGHEVLCSVVSQLNHWHDGLCCWTAALLFWMNRRIWCC